jgi:glycosyltransferase involved in cell wall biosynthesis
VPPLVSVLTPVYNGGTYLRECVDSVLRQSYDDWEHVIVDNRSTDATPAIAAEYAARDPRIRHVRFEEFVERDANHDRAFDQAGPEAAFVKVVQADDWLFPECLERMVGLASKHPTVGVVSAYRLKQTLVDLDGLPYDQDVYQGREIVLRALRGELVGIGSPTTLLWRADLVRAPRPFYDPTMYVADLDAVLRSLFEANFGFVHQVLTFSRRQGDSAIDTAERLSAFNTEFIRLLLRYGPDMLPREEYRRRLRSRLSEYLRWHLKQGIRPSRRRDGAFAAYHRRQLQLIVAESGHDRDVRATARIVSPLLGRE